jgi:adenylate cyclase
MRSVDKPLLSAGPRAQASPEQAERGLLAWLERHPVARGAADWAQWLAELGTAGYRPEIRRRLLILNLIAYLIFATTLVYVVQYLSLAESAYRPVALINLALMVAAALVPLAHRVSDIAGALLIVVSEFVAMLAFALYLGRDSGVHLQYFVAAAAPFVVFGLERIGLVLAFVVAGLLLHLTVWFHIPPDRALIPPEPDFLDNLYVQAAVTTVGLIAASVWYAFRLAERAKAETDTLLRNILPDPIADRLKARPGEPIADSYRDASVLFADISGFVALARRLGPASVVELLNHMVSEFDALAARHGVEKIKTIGDAYMAVAGVPEPAPDHAQRLVRLALDMLATVERVKVARDIDLRMRVGIASGPVLAGVIGTRKFSFDVWGDPVNLAARLERLSMPGRIHVCPTCRERLASEFELESRGAIEIRGLGTQETWFITASSPASPPR